VARLPTAASGQSEDGVVVLDSLSFYSPCSE
jgi:hypothetical protein